MNHIKDIFRNNTITQRISPEVEQKRLISKKLFKQQVTNKK